jgi:hypothetical protein
VVWKVRVRVRVRMMVSVVWKVRVKVRRGLPTLADEGYTPETFVFLISHGYQTIFLPGSLFFVKVRVMMMVGLVRKVRVRVRVMMTGAWYGRLRLGLEI